MTARNPFDDSYHRNVEAARSTNPFDHQETATEGTSSGQNFAYENDDDEDDDNIDGAFSDGNHPNLNDDPAEASWQYLGVLPYRRIPVYSNVQWDGGGLASYPGTLLNHAASSAANTTTTTAGTKTNKMVFTDPQKLLQKTTVVKCVACPHGGPIATVTLPLTAATHFPTTLLRIMTVSGKVLAKLEFPFPSLLQTQRRYTPFDILQIGFTSRCVLIVVLKDSTCLTLNLQGEPVLPPFGIFPTTATTDTNTQLQLAEIYDGGVAVVAGNNNRDAALVELLDQYDSIEYLQTIHPAMSRIVGDNPLLQQQSTTGTNTSGVGGPPLLQSSSDPSSRSTRNGTYAVITQLPTSTFASTRHIHYTALAVLPRTRTEHRHPELFLATSDHSVVIANCMTLELTDVNCRDRLGGAPIVDMCLAPNGRFLACFTEQSMLTVVSTNFETKVLDFDTSEGSNRSTPLEMQWCGEDSVVLHWKNLGVLMVGPYGDWLRFPYNNNNCGEHLFLLPEMDCCRVVTDRTVEILQRVPPATALLLRIGSIETSAMLLDAADAYYAGRGGTTSNGGGGVLLPPEQLQEAIETCIDSATKEFDIWTQKRLLRAASYGMHFAYKQQSINHANKEDAAADEDTRILIGGPVTGSQPETGLLPTKTTVQFVDAARKLRILNALRNPDVGWVLTVTQLDALTPTGVVARLVAVQRAELAVEISKYWKLSQQVQLYARAAKASAFVESATEWSDSETAEKAIRILHDGSSTDAARPSWNRGGYAMVAQAATRVQRPGVANLLLLLESSVADKVPALLSTGNYSDAMAVATSARDADLIFATLTEYERACMLAASATDVAKAQVTFFNSVVTSFTSEGIHTLRRYLQTTGDTKKLTTFLLKGQRTADAGAAYATRALTENDFREKQGLLSEASRIFGLGKETAFHKSCTDDYVELLKDQETLRKKYGAHDVAPVSTSVTATIAAVLKYASTNEGMREQHRLLQDADKLARRFRIPDKRFWHIKVKAFADSDQWSNLKSMAESRKSPIGYAPFALAVIRGKQPESEIKFYLRKVAAPEERYNLLCDAGLWKDALEVATELKDARRLLNIKSLCNNEAIQLQVDQRLGSLA